MLGEYFRRHLERSGVFGMGITTIKFLKEAPEKLIGGDTNDLQISVENGFTTWEIPDGKRIEFLLKGDVVSVNDNRGRGHGHRAVVHNRTQGGYLLVSAGKSEGGEPGVLFKQGPARTPLARIIFRRG